MNQGWVFLFRDAAFLKEIMDPPLHCGNRLNQTCLDLRKRVAAKNSRKFKPLKKPPGFG